MTQIDDVSVKPGDASVQIARLRAQVEELMKDRVIPAVADFAGRAEAAVSDARHAVRNQAESVSNRVRQQPLIAVVVAAGIGWVVGRLMR
jgi:ElaB/YqjD/DUF883 family membrane-anchored ribosome-binding protein